MCFHRARGFDLRVHADDLDQSLGNAVRLVGHLIAASDHHRPAELGDLDARFARGEFAPLREWLKENVYRHGRRYPPQELLRRVTGSEIDVAPYLGYLRAKFAP